MRRSALTTGCVVITTMLGVLGSPVAQADDDSFVRRVQALGFVQSSDSLVSTAQSACYFLLRNRDPQEIEQRIVRYTRIEPPSQAHSFLVLSVDEYCPQYGGVVGP